MTIAILAGALVLAQAEPPASAPAAPAAPATSARPAGTTRARSVLFYLIDTCRADRMSMNGHDRPTTPFLEELAERGVRFAHCFSQAPWTKPSVASILTSCYPSVTGMHRLLDQLDSDFVTLPEALRGAGWFTVGYSANPLMGRLSNYNQGFRRFLDAALVIPGGDCVNYASGSGRALNRHVLPWIETNEEWPYFLYVHSVDPHEEYEPAEEYLRLFADPGRDPEYRRAWQALLDVKTIKIGNYCTAETFKKAGVEVGPFVGHGKDLYDADVRANDHEISRLIDALAARGELDDMIIVITSDHGEEFMEHGGTSHAYMLWNELIHVPLLVVAPGLLPEGLVVEAPVQSIDIYPTLLELLGVPAPEGLQGRSFAALLRGEGGGGRAIFAENHGVEGGEQYFLDQGNTLAVIEGAWKYILNVKSPHGRERPRHELYRLDVDFAERNDVAPAHPELVERFESMVLEWWARNLARHEGVEVDSLTLEDLRHADPETLEQLRRLGYVRIP